MVSGSWVVAALMRAGSAAARRGARPWLAVLPLLAALALLGQGACRAGEAPRITSPSTARGTRGVDAVQYTITANSFGAPILFYGAINLPPGLALNQTTGVISGTPTQAGTFNASVEAENVYGVSPPFAVKFTIAPAAPVINSGLSASGQVGFEFNYQITATNSPTSFNATGLPSGLFVNTTTGAIGGPPSVSGTFSVTISATNSGGTGTAILVLTVNPDPPVISSPLTDFVNSGAAFSYAISATNNPTSFNATGLPTGLSVNTASGLISGSTTAYGVYSVALSATNAGGTGTATLTLTVIPPPPVINGPFTATGQQGTAFTYQISATNSPTSYGASGLPGGLSVNTTSGAITGTTSAVGVFSVELSASNGGGTGTNVLTLTINPPPPVITSATNASGVQGKSFSYQITASNSPTTYNATNLPAGLAVNTTSGAIIGVPSAGGTTAVTISATNAGGTGSATLTITVSLPAPVITSGATASGTQGQPFGYTITASNSPTSFGASNLPTGLSVNTSTGAITGTPTGSGTTAATISATNAAGTGSATLTITIALAAPVITSAATASGQQGSSFSYQIAASHSPTSFGASGLPAGLSVSASSGLISGTPTASGSFSAAISATNAAGTGSATLTIAIAPATPVITSALTAAGTVGSAFSYQIAASNRPTSFNAATLPAGLVVNTTSGLISGTPSATGTTVVTITATNAGGTGSATLAIAINAIPAITSAATASGQAGSAFSFQITASGAPTSFGATPLPAGLSVSAATGLISGTPTAAGTTATTVSATNAGGTGSATLTITINPPAPVITSALSASGAVGSAFSYQITASNSPTAFNATGLPSGLVVYATSGVISGTPSATGTTVVPISATNGGGTGSASLTIAISARPVITSAATAGGAVGVAFSYQITASNSPTSFGAAPLPAGLSVNTATGLISGTPTAAGTTATIVTATNAAGSGSATVSIAIVPAAPAITSALTASGATGQPFSYQITASNSPISYAASGLPTGLAVICTSGLISGTPGSAATAVITVSATNAGGTGTASVTVTISATLQPPVITSAGSADGQVGSAFSYQITASNSPTSFAAAALPPGLSVNATTGAITGPPTQTGTFAVTVSATNAAGSGHATVNVTVVPATPVITSATTASGLLGTPFSYQITAINSPATFGASSLPGGLVVNSTTGAITGTPTTAATTIITVSATNAGGSGTQSVTLTIGVPPAPVITSPTSASASVGLAFLYQITASNGPTSFNATGLPSGLVVNTTTGAITGTVDAAISTTFTVSAGNATGSGHAAVTFTATIPPPPVVTSSSSSSATTASGVSYQITATNSPTSYSASGLPSGLSVAPDTGLVSGSVGTPGVMSFTVIATNAGGSGSQQVSLTVYPASGPSVAFTSASCGVGQLPALILVLGCFLIRRAFRP